MTLWSRCCGDICICGQTERLDFCKTYDIGHTWSWRSHARTQCACKEHWQRRKSCSPCTATLPPSSPSATWPCYQMPRWPHPRKSLFKKPFQKWKLAKAKLLPWEPNSSVNGKTVDLKNEEVLAWSLFIGAGTLICGQTRPSECCRTFHTVDTHGLKSWCVLPQCENKGWSASSQRDRRSTASLSPPAATSWKRPLHKREYRHKQLRSRKGHKSKAYLTLKSFRLSLFLPSVCFIDMECHNCFTALKATQPAAPGPFAIPRPQSTTCWHHLHILTDKGTSCMKQGWDKFQLPLFAFDFNLHNIALRFSKTLQSRSGSPFSGTRHNFLCHFSALSSWAAGCWDSEFFPLHSRNTYTSTPLIGLVAQARTICLLSFGSGPRWTRLLISDLLVSRSDPQWDLIPRPTRSYDWLLKICPEDRMAKNGDSKWQRIECRKLRQGCHVNLLWKQFPCKFSMQPWCDSNATAQTAGKWAPNLCCRKYLSFAQKWGER